MTRIYHTWDKWECYPAGFYNSVAPDGLTAAECNQRYADFLRDTERFSKALWQVLTTWTRSCEHYLSNEKMNRIAWLGQAAMCVATGIPSTFRGGFNQLSPEEQAEANETALQALNEWLVCQREPKVDMAGAGVNEKANIY